MRRRAGLTCLEVQASLVVLGIGLAGICPLVVMQSRLLRRFESTAIGPDGAEQRQVVRGVRLIDGEPYAAEGALDAPPVTVLQPSADPWVRRLGGAAPFQNDVVAPATPASPRPRLRVSLRPMSDDERSAPTTRAARRARVGAP